MNCEEFRRQLAKDPYCKDASIRDHPRMCPECARAVQEALRFEQDLRAALIAELPPDRAQDLRLRKPLGIGLRLPLVSFSLLLALLWLAYGLDLGPDPNGDLAALVIAHIRAEERDLLRTERVPASRLQVLFQSFGAEVDPVMGDVSFATPCIVGNTKGIHLVLSGRYGAVDALLLPDTQITEELDITGSGLAGAILPTGWGALAIVGKPNEQLEPVAHRLLARVHWVNRG